MSANSSNELLEPQLSPQRSREKLVRNLLVNKPEIFRVSGPGILDQVKSFLPQMAEAENQLNQAIDVVNDAVNHMQLLNQICMKSSSRQSSGGEVAHVSAT